MDRYATANRARHARKPTMPLVNTKPSGVVAPAGSPALRTPSLAAQVGGDVSKQIRWFFELNVRTAGRGRSAALDG